MTEEERRERNRNYMREYRKTHPEYILRQREYYRNRTDYQKERSRNAREAWVKAHPEKVKEYAARYQQNHKEERNEYMREYRKAHPEYVEWQREYQREWYYRNKTKGWGYGKAAESRGCGTGTEREPSNGLQHHARNVPRATAAAGNGRSAADLDRGEHGSAGGHGGGGENAGTETDEAAPAYGLPHKEDLNMQGKEKPHAEEAAQGEGEDADKNI